MLTFIKSQRFTLSLKLCGSFGYYRLTEEGATAIQFCRLIVEIIHN